MPLETKGSELNLGPLLQVLRSKTYILIAVYLICSGYAIIPDCLATKPARRGRVVRIFTDLDLKAGDVSLLPNGHDAWVVGNEPAVVVDFQGMIDYAKDKAKK